MVVSVSSKYGSLFFASGFNTQLKLQVVGQCPVYTRSRGGDKISERLAKLAHQKPEKSRIHILLEILNYNKAEHKLESFV